jgi:hypothetical protein
MESRDAVRLAAGVASRGVQLKIGVWGALAFLVFLLCVGVMGAITGATKAQADSCSDRGTPDVDLGDDSTIDQGQGKLRERQVANAKSIDAIAKKGKLSGRATLVGLMAALQESQLLNIKYGHSDSIGLFQQRPSAGWGTKEQIMKPAYAAKMFFYGADSGSPRGLTDVKGWESMQLGDAAQAVQHSAFPALYEGQEKAAKSIAKQAGISLSRAGTGGATPAPEGDSSGKPGTSGGTKCLPKPGEGGGDGGAPGKPFHDGNAGWPDNVTNRRSTKEAIEWARKEAESGGGNWYRLCLMFVGRAYGWNSSGTPLAIDHYRKMPDSMKHDKDRNPPPGALMFWDTGKAAGHVAIYLGNGKIASNDIRRPGYIDIVPATDIEKDWGAKYVGWSPPYFPNGG